MRFVLLIAAILTLVLSYIMIVNKRSTESKNVAASFTKIMVPKTIINIGDRIVNTTATGRFVIYNIGEKRLMINRVEPDCHCTVGEFSKEPVRPMDSTVIILRYDSTRLGVFQSTALVQSNADQTPLLLVLRGNIINNPLQKTKN